MGWKFEPYVVKFDKFQQIFRPIIRAQLLKASSPILNFKSHKKPEPKGYNLSPKATT
jgi:hypothetical protein